MSVEANDMSKEAKEQRSVSEHLGELNIQSYLEKDNSQPVAWMDVDEKGAASGLRYWSEPDNRHEVALYSAPQQSAARGLSQQRKPLTDERLELIGHADLAINNIYIFNGYGEDVPEGRTPIYAGYKAAHCIKE